MVESLWQGGKEKVNDITLSEIAVQIVSDSLLVNLWSCQTVSESEGGSARSLVMWQHMHLLLVIDANLHAKVHQHKRSVQIYFTAIDGAIMNWICHEF